MNSIGETDRTRCGTWRRARTLALAALSVAACASSEPLWSPGWTSGGGLYTAPPVATGIRARTRVAQLPDHDRLPDSFMMVVLYDGAGGELERWGGPIDLRIDKPTRYRARRTGGRWLWSEAPSARLRVKAPTRTSSRAGQDVTAWATDMKAARLVVTLVPHPGEAQAGASRTGMGTSGQGRGWNSVRPMRTVPPPAHDPNAPVSDQASTGLGETGDGPGRGQGQGPSDAAGTNTKGTRRGVPTGGEDPSWVHNPRAELARQGGRTPADGGKAHGSASGKAGGLGHVGGAGYINLLDVPESVAPAVAATVILLDADVLGFAQKLLNRVIGRLVGDALEEAIELEAKAAVKRHLEDARARMAKVKNPPPVEQIDEVMEYMPEDMLGAYYRQLARVADERKQIYRATVAKTDGQTDDGAAYIRTLAKQNAHAWDTIEQAARRRLAAEEADAAKRSVASASSAASAPATSVRSGTAVSTPAHTTVHKGGKAPVLKGLRGEARVRAVYDIGDPKRIRVNGRWRVPDGIKNKVLSEVKNVKKLSYRSQLRDYAKYARTHDLKFHLYVRIDTKLSKPLKAATDTGEIELRYIP